MPNGIHLLGIVVISLLLVGSAGYYTLNNSATDDYIVPRITSNEAYYSLDVLSDPNVSFEMIVPIPWGWNNSFFNLTIINTTNYNSTIKLTNIDGAPAISIKGVGNFSIEATDMNFGYYIQGFYGHYTDNSTFKFFITTFPESANLTIKLYYRYSWEYASDPLSSGINEVYITGASHPSRTDPLEINKDGWQWIRYFETST